MTTSNKSSLAYRSKHRNPDTLARKIVLGLPEHLRDNLTEQQVDALSIIATDMLIEYRPWETPRCRATLGPESKVATWLRDVLEVAAYWGDF